MARSSYIYIITRDTGCPADTVVAAFTVKHECQSFIEDSDDPEKGAWVVRRYPDSPYEEESGVVVTFDS